MKNIFYLFFFTSFIAAQACGQSKTFDKLAYAASIEKAENFILENDYEKAVKNYNDSFKLNTTMFSVDLYNAFLCNVYLKKWEACEVWSTRLFNKGVTIDFFKANKFAEFKRTKQWKNVLKKFSKHKSKIDFDYVRVLDSLVIEDQKIYCGIPTGVLNYEEAKENTLTVEEKFAFLLNKYGYPTEEKVGIKVYNDTIISDGPKFVVLLRHGYQSGNKVLLDIFKTALKKGTMDQRIDLLSLNDNMDFMVYKGTMYKRKSKLIKEDLAREKRLKFINANRQSGFLIFAQYSTIGSLADESSVDAFHKMYDVFIPNWNEEH